ncbi:TRAPP trafficking subunit Trs65-domain-containing protein [Rhodocollybia butyracea]|uniref:TRAPP trafficking subunit Trs65-domain-containing protein n=1 Tax=Rhodocollybia butyracea TaxID=206335 RepID=A0A9P5UFG0_9AGAR|nr:TRAPP trafficking subunit Trs65-domain-containing protein [Rhodocollybia butyracea]
MSSFSDLFTSAVLDVVVPESSINFPPGPDTDEWLEQLNNVDRKEAFFDEHLQTLFTLRVPQPEPIPLEPPPLLLDFLGHVQVLLEASYISPNEGASEYNVSPSPLPSGKLHPSSPPPRTSSIKKPSHLNLSLSPNPRHPSILPPATPNPTPASAAVDQRYIQAEGIMLTSKIWGHDSAAEAFYLLWSQREQAWVAVYSTVLDIAFLRLNFDSPLLCLTLSATLRDKPLALASPLAVYLKAVGNLSIPASPTSPSTPHNEEAAEELENGLAGPPEINLLAGLYAGPTFAPASSMGRSSTTNTPTGTPTNTVFAANDNDDLKLSSTRLGPASRSKLFALAPIEPETPTSSAMTTPTPLPGQSAHFRQPTRGKPVLRKSFRKILETASGFRVRMRTVFVPAVLLDDNDNQDIEEVDDDDPDRLTSGASERTVVLCVEIETEGDPLFRPADAPDFVVEKVDVSITGSAGGGDDGATARLIGWDDAKAIASKGGKTNFPQSSEKTSFPLYLAPHEQHNLLYAVSFLRSPQEEALDAGPSSLTTGIGMNALPSAGVVGPNGAVKQNAPDKSLQRAVTINIFGKPCYATDESSKDPAATGNKAYHYPTATFSSRWNCVLDLSLSQQLPRRDYSHEYGDETPLPTMNALPEPPSPFPVPVSLASGSSFPSLPASSSYPSIASIVSPRDRRSIGFGLDLDFNDGRPSSSLAWLPPSSATTDMSDKRHTLPTVPKPLPPYIQSAGPGGGIERPGSTSSVQSWDRRESLRGLGIERRDSFPMNPSPTTSLSKYAPPSVTLTPSAVQQAQSLRSPTTYEAPPPHPTWKGDRDRGAGIGLSVTIPSGDLAPPTPNVHLPPMTPAYPAFPINNNISETGVNGTGSAFSPTPVSQGPLIPHGGNLIPNSAYSPGGSMGYVGPSVEVRRERGMGGMGGYGGYGVGSATPQTPAPVVGFGFGNSGRPSRQGTRGGTPSGGGLAVGRFSDNQMRGASAQAEGGSGGESIVVSVGLLPQSIRMNQKPKTSFESSSPLLPPSISFTVPRSRSQSKPEKLNMDPNSNSSSPKINENLIYPLSTFIIDIFVFNRSTWTRRFEVSCPDSRSRRKRKEIESLAASRSHEAKRRVNPLSVALPDPGVLPLENKVRIGPLLPSACQSVRMKFLALSPGVHSIDTLTLTDVESGLAMNLRSVMDVVVHEPT